MTSQLFSHQQMFKLKRKTIEKRLSSYWKETKDEKLTIKYLIALQVRDRIGEEDFSFMLEDLVKEIFLNTKSTRTLRRYYYKFKEYFDKKEWEKLTVRLFPAKTYTSEDVEELEDQLTDEINGAFSVP